MSMLILAVFIIGYLFIVFEHKIKLDKAATALITGVVCWVVLVFSTRDTDHVNHQLLEHISGIAGILFFLIGAMTIVELIDLYDGFQIIVDKITTTHKKKLMMIITLISFFLSAILDNLTTVIVMGSLIRKILSEKEDRLFFLAIIVIAANAGGAWSPIGDVTTTMLWIGNQISPLGVIKQVFIPSLIATITPMLYLLFRVKGDFVPIVQVAEVKNSNKDKYIILLSGILLLLFVPVFKMITHLPPFMGMMLAVGILWLISETLEKKNHAGADDKAVIFSALEKIDMPSILFFMGILLAVGALQSYGILQSLADWLTQSLRAETLLVLIIGLFSAVFDNVPLVAAVQGMFDLNQYPTDHFFWIFLTYCSGTGGSILIIGSAAGVAAMGIEKITFFWYLKNISLITLLAYLLGAIACVLI